MRKRSIARVTMLAVTLLLLTGTQPTAQQRADPGVTFTRLIDREEIRISRVVLEPGATRQPHSHNDVHYHAWVPLEGSFELSLGTDAPVPASAGDAFFLERGTMHGFRNVGTTDAAVMEVFVLVTDGADTASRRRLRSDVAGGRLAALVASLADAAPR